MWGATLDALLATCFTWGVTAAGAALVFVLPSDEATQTKVLLPMLGFAGGVMTSAAFFSLLAPALELAEAQYGERWAFVPVTLGFALGGAGMLLTDDILERHGDVDPLELMEMHMGPGKRRRAKEDPPVSSSSAAAAAASASAAGGRGRGRKAAVRRRHESRFSLEQGSLPASPSGSDFEMDDPDSAAKKFATQRKAISLLVLAITLHNFPEGLAVGVGFGGASAGLEGASRAKARNLALGIGLQNFPEGLAVSMPLRRAGFSPWRAFFFGQLSGAVEPIGGVLGAWAVLLVTPILPYALAFAAGAMIYVVVDQLLPESRGALGEGKSAKHQTLGFMLGFCLMMALDIALG